MLYSALLLCVSSASCSYKVSTAVKAELTTQSTTTEKVIFVSVKKMVRGGSNYTYD